MTKQTSFSQLQPNQEINSEQLNQIVEAILNGKYSWACVLLLRHIGYNPLNYIPYRTHNRLLKENCTIGNSNSAKTVPINKNQRKAMIQATETASSKGLSKIIDLDLAYLETADESSHQVKGGNLGYYRIF